MSDRYADFPWRKPTTTGLSERVRRLLLNEYGIPRRMQNLRLTKDMPSAARAFIASLQDHLGEGEDLSKTGVGLIFAGLPGRGKTTAATATLIEALYHGVRPVYFVAYADYIANRKSQFAMSGASQDPEKWAQIERQIDAVKTAPLLVLDDVGKEAETDRSRFAANELDLLLRQRYRDALPTLITTNLAPSEWGAAYNESMGSFIKEAFEYVPMKGADRRS